MLSVLILNLIFTYVYKMIFLFVFLVFNSSCAVSCKCSWLLGKRYIVCLFRIAILNVEFVCFCLYSNYNKFVGNYGKLKSNGINSSRRENWNWASRIGK